MQRNPDTFEVTYYSPYDRYEHSSSIHFDTRDYAERVVRSAAEARGLDINLLINKGIGFGNLTNDIHVIHKRIIEDLEKSKNDPIGSICQIREVWCRPDDIRFSEKAIFHFYVLCNGSWHAVKEDNLLKYPVIAKEEFVSVLEGEPDIDWIF